MGGDTGHQSEDKNCCRGSHLCRKKWEARWVRCFGREVHCYRIAMDTRYPRRRLIKWTQYSMRSELTQRYRFSGSSRYCCKYRRWEWPSVESFRQFVRHIGRRKRKKKCELVMNTVYIKVPYELNRNVFFGMTPRWSPGESQCFHRLLCVLCVAMCGLRERHIK